VGGWQRRERVGAALDGGSGWSTLAVGGGAPEKTARINWFLTRAKEEVQQQPKPLMPQYECNCECCHASRLPQPPHRFSW
jgi:hypothetical protein